MANAARGAKRLVYTITYFVLVCVCASLFVSIGHLLNVFI